MVAAGNGAGNREHRRRDNRVQLRSRGDRDDDHADQRAGPPARARAGGPAGRVQRPVGWRQRVGRQRGRVPPGGDRQRGQLLPAAGEHPHPRPDGNADLGQHQQQQRRPRTLVRRLRQPHAGAGGAGGRPAELGQRRGELSVAAAGLGRRAGRYEPGLPRSRVARRRRPGARPLPRPQRRLPAPAGRLGAVRRPRRGRHQRQQRGAAHHRGGLAAGTDGQRALLRRAAGESRRGRLRRQRQSQGGWVRFRGRVRFRRRVRFRGRGRLWGRGRL